MTRTAQTMRRRASVLLLAIFLITACLGPWRVARATVPVSDSVVRFNTGSLVTKIVAVDPAATFILKVIIKLARDMVIRWLITGRFEAPVFSASLMIDLTKTAENASRIFLSSVFGGKINFCEGLHPPTIDDFIFNLDLTLSCTLPGNLDRNYTNTIIKLATEPNSLTPEERALLGDPQNQAIYSYYAIESARHEAIARALIAQSAEYAAGQGFLGIRDPAGLISTPGKYVYDLVKETNIVGPQRTADVASTVQQAVDAIIQTAIQVTLEKGLRGIFQKKK